MDRPTHERRRGVCSRPAFQRGSAASTRTAASRQHDPQEQPCAIPRPQQNTPHQAKILITLLRLGWATRYSTRTTRATHSNSRDDQVLRRSLEPKLPKWGPITLPQSVLQFCGSSGRLSVAKEVGPLSSNPARSPSLRCCAAFGEVNRRSCVIESGSQTAGSASRDPGWMCHSIRPLLVRPLAAGRLQRQRTAAFPFTACR
jgi:hypothetical protein